ncbi:BTAD domain-containing putative transcriptional regulator [Dankookia sp. P2]|uniref:BTAD domain-containing putative transcriptional regulator n=1 Tax=Dankookia sp. P2 TaxID=3423955 RepID=UPI003D67C8C6
MNTLASKPTRIRMLGTFDARLAEGTPVAGLGRRTIALLACLSASDESWTRDDLAELLWSGRSLDQRRASLRQELLRLRRALGWRAGDDAAPQGRVRLPEKAVEIDVVAFRRAILVPDGASAAIAAYRGPLLQGFRLEPRDPFAAWLARQRAVLHAAAMDVMLGVLRSGAGSAELARRILSLDDACEEAHRFLIRRHAEQGDMGQALAQFRACAEALRTGRGAEPSAETCALLDDVTISLGAKPPPCPPTAVRPPGAAVDWIRRAPDRAPMPATPDAQPLPVVEDRPSVAVLPFAALSHDLLAGSTLADGMTEEVTNALARMPGFFVTARQSALAYRGVALDARRIASDLGVRYLVEGSVEQDGRRMRADLRLIEGRTGLHLWADSEDGPLGEVMAVRDAVVHRLASRLQPRLMMEEIARAVRRPPRDMDAWTWLQRANAVLLRGRHREALDQVMEPLRRALEADPHYAMANALLSAVHTWRAVSQLFPDPPGEKRLARARRGGAGGGAGQSLRAGALR